jgi:hypothetical protein
MGVIEITVRLNSHRDLGAWRQQQAVVFNLGAHPLLINGFDDAFDAVHLNDFLPACSVMWLSLYQSQLFKTISSSVCSAASTGLSKMRL